VADKNVFLLMCAIPSSIVMHLTHNKALKFHIWFLCPVDVLCVVDVCSYTEHSTVGLAQQWDQLDQLCMRMQHNLEQQIQAW